MLRVWQKRLLDNKPSVYLEFKSGTHEVELTSGQYEIILIGAGGFSAYLSRVVVSRPTILYEYFGAQGGVGGTARARLNITGSPTVTIHVGERGGDKDTYITGVEGFTLRAGGGTDSNVTSYNSGTAGQMGQNTMEGAFLSLESNAITIDSKTTYNSKASQLPLRFMSLANANYPEDPTYGSANTTTKETGLVIIRSI